MPIWEGSGLVFTPSPQAQTAIHPPIDVVANTCDIAGTVGTQEDKAATKRFS